MPSGKKTIKKVADKKIQVVDSPVSLIASTVMEDAGANITKAATEIQGSQVRPGTKTNNGNADGGGIVKQDDNDSAKAGINLSAVTNSTDAPGQPNDVTELGRLMLSEDPKIVNIGNKKRPSNEESFQQSDNSDCGERVSDLYLHPGAAVEKIVRTPKVARIERIKALEICKGSNHDMLDIEFGKFHSLQICIEQTSGMGNSNDVEGSINLEPINQVEGISMAKPVVCKQTVNPGYKAIGDHELRASARAELAAPMLDHLWRVWIRIHFSLNRNSCSCGERLIQLRFCRM